MTDLQPQFQTGWDVVQNANKYKMQGFANLLNPYFIYNNTENILIFFNDIFYYFMKSIRSF